MTYEKARELLEAFFVKFNNHPAPPKVGVTAAESGTYTDFANINIGGLLADGGGRIERSLPPAFGHHRRDAPAAAQQQHPAIAQNAGRPVEACPARDSQGIWIPSIFNTDTVVEEQLRQGKSLDDARAGGCSGCVETGAFGKEAYILTGYFNLVKILELTLHDGVDPRTGSRLGLRTGAADDFASFDALMQAFRRQMRHFLEIKLRGNQLIEQMYAALDAGPFPLGYYRRLHPQGQGLQRRRRPVQQQLRPVRGHRQPDRLSLRAEAGGLRGEGHAFGELVRALDADFEGQEILRQRLLNRTHKYGNDDDYADQIMVRAFQMIFEELDGRPNSKGGRYRVEMLPTTSHIYFGSVTGAMPDGRKAGLPLSEGISPVQGADRHGPTAVLKSAGKMDHVKTGGTLLNMKFTPSLVSDEDGIDKLAHLVRSYFKLGGHHVQFNVVRAETLRQAQAAPSSIAT